MVLIPVPLNHKKAIAFAIAFFIGIIYELFHKLLDFMSLRVGRGNGLEDIDAGGGTW